MIYDFDFKIGSYAEMIINDGADEINTKRVRIVGSQGEGEDKEYIVIAPEKTLDILECKIDNHNITFFNESLPDGWGVGVAEPDELWPSDQQTHLTRVK